MVDYPPPNETSLYCNKPEHQKNPLSYFCQCEACENKQMLCRICIDDHHKEHRERIAAANEISDFLQDISFKLKADRSLDEALKSIKSSLAESLTEISQFRTTINNSLNLFEEKVK